MTQHDGLHQPAGSPDLQLGSLAIWVRGREFSDSQDYRDANWLSVLMQVDAAYAVVQAEGPILHAGELSDLVDGCKRLYRDMKGELVFDAIEPNFRLKMAIDARGQLDVSVDLTGDRSCSPTTSSSRSTSPISRPSSPGDRTCWSDFRSSDHPAGPTIRDDATADDSMRTTIRTSGRQGMGE